jgi:hypothetical protein
MAKFGKSIPADDTPPPVVEPAPVIVAAPPPVDNTPVPEFSMPDTQQEPKAEESWVKSMWRPAMGWLYMIICFMDFVAFPAISMFMPILIKGMPYMAWQSLTLSNGGLIHMAFGAILGVAAYGRTQEKVASKQ